MAIEDVIAEQSVTIANQMLQIAEYAKSEREVELECFAQIKAFCTKAGVKIAGEFDRTIGSGRPDAHYQGLIIEYKDPSNPATRIGPGSESAGTKAVVKQIKERFPELERELHYPLKRLMGVGCDGRMLVFVRYRDGRWDVENPQPVTSHSVERLLRALISLGAQGKSFTPEFLADDFGSNSEIAQRGVRDLYTTITTTKSKKVLTFFSQWKILFGEVCGYDVEGKNTKIQKLGEHYGIPDAQPAELLFAIHTYYAVFMKFLAAEIAGSFSPLRLSSLKACVGAPTSAALRREMESLEQGGIWSQLKITNFLEGDLFAWYLDAWNDRVSDAVRGIVLRLDGYDPTTLSVDPAESRDLLKKLYQQLFPKSVRHDLGEYYTPDWLAEHVLNELGYEGDPDKRLLDPACGSGTFLVMAINRIKAWFEEHRHECGYGEAELIQKILRNVIGFDLNPLAVMASRTNYLMSLRDLLKHAASVEIPVYLCDSIITPAEYGDLFTGGLGTVKKLKTSAAEFLIPTEIAASRERMGKYAETLEFCVRQRYSDDDFLSRCVEEGLPTEQADLHRQLFSDLRRLDADNENGIWARIIKNAFAPLFIDEVDFVVGNPPWVNYENLPADYREASAYAWEQYGLFPRGGWRARFAKGNTELAMIFVYATMDHYLTDSGRLGFLVTQSVFQSKDAGRGFRAFNVVGRGKIRIEHVNDLTSIRPFEDAANRTATLVAAFNKDGTTYPVSYTEWHSRARERPDSSWGLQAVLDATTRRARLAWPVADPQSPWMILPGGISKHTVSKLQRGQQVYRAWKGCDTRGGNGVFWLQVLGQERGLVVARNTPEFSKKKPPEVTWSFEPDLIYPLLKGRETSRWHTSPEYQLIYPHRGDSAIPEPELKRAAPRTHAYFRKMGDYLRARRMFDLSFRDLAFYSLFETGDFLVAPFKVVWKEIASRVECAVQPILAGSPVQNRIVIPDHKLVVVPFESEAEAHYVCALLNSSPSRFVASTYIVGTQISTHVLEYVIVPRFNDKEQLHRKLSSLSERCHENAAAGDSSTVAALEAEIDGAAAEIWQLTPEELSAMQERLREVEGPASRRRTTTGDEEEEDSE